MAPKEARGAGLGSTFGLFGAGENVHSGEEQLDEEQKGPEMALNRRNLLL